MKLHLWVLTSGSSGNCILIWNGRGAVMVDCGLGPRSLAPYLERIGLDLACLDGVLLTHLHGDHFRETTLRRLMHKGVPLHCHQKIARHLSRGRDPIARAVNLRLLKPFGDRMFSAGPFRVKPFEVFHDSPGGCYGFTLFARTGTGIKKVSIATDIGSYDTALVRRFADSDVVVIESNYDDDLLEQTERPRWLKDRIREVHFSNDQCACFVCEVLARSRRKPVVIVQAHVSQESNTVEVARNHLRARLGYGHHPRLVETFHLRESELITIE